MMNLRERVEDGLYWARSPRTAHIPTKFARLVKDLEQALIEDACVCNVGVQECIFHPNRLKTQDEKIAFRKAWDERVQLAKVIEP